MRFWNRSSICEIKITIKKDFSEITSSFYCAIFRSARKKGSGREPERGKIDK